MLTNMENLNQQLITINEEITNKISSGQPIYDSNEVEIAAQSNQLKSDYNNLLRKKKNIQNLWIKTLTGKVGLVLSIVNVV